MLSVKNKLMLNYLHERGADKALLARVVLADAPDAALRLDAVEDDVGADVEVVLGSSLVHNALRMSDRTHTRQMYSSMLQHAHTHVQRSVPTCIFTAACVCVHIAQHAWLPTPASRKPLSCASLSY
jgi:hypothetical protein